MKGLFITRLIILMHFLFHTINSCIYNVKISIVFIFSVYSRLLVNFINSINTATFCCCSYQVSLKSRLIGESRFTPLDKYSLSLSIVTDCCASFEEVDKIQAVLASAISRQNDKDMSSTNSPDMASKSISHRYEKVSK
jgi:hypothetical protein